MRRLIITAMAVLATVSVPSFTYAQAREGITVHGHWAIEIRNPDGSLASRHEFENALTQQGQRVMAGLLGRYNTVAAWTVTVGATQICSIDETNPVSLCTVGDPLLANAALPSHDLTVTMDPSTGASRLSGSVRVAADGTIGSVQSAIVACRLSTETMQGTPGLQHLCIGPPAVSQLTPFSERILPSPIAVQAGQIVQVTVTFTFS